MQYISFCLFSEGSVISSDNLASSQPLYHHSIDDLRQACLTSPQGQVESYRISQGREYYGEVGIGGFFPEVKCEAGQYLTLIIIFFQMYVQFLKTNTFFMKKKLFQWPSDA